MIISRILLMIMLLGCSGIFGMENWQKRRMVDIDTILEAIDVNDIEFIETYIDNGGNINVKGTIPASPYLQEMREMTPIMATAFYGRPRLMKIFIQNGAELNWTNEFGDTALIMAARIQYASLVRLLTKAGAKKDIRNNNGKTAFDEACNSLLRSRYSNCSGKFGKNRNFSRMIRLLKTREDDTTSLVQTHINRQVVKIDNRRSYGPSLQYSGNPIGYYVPMVNTGYYPVMYIQQF